MAFFVAFAVKVPMWPVHTWLPDAHVEAPTGGSVVLAAITLKVGAYGFIRLVLPILPDASRYLSGFVIALSLVAIVYIGFRLAKNDRLFVDLAHGLRHSGFFLCASASKAGADDLARFVSAPVPLRGRALRPHAQPPDRGHGGVVSTMPKFAAFAMLFLLTQLRDGVIRGRVH